MTIDFWQSLEVSLVEKNQIEASQAQQAIAALRDQCGNISPDLVQQAKGVFSQPGWKIKGNVVQIIINVIQERVEELKSIPQNLPRSGVVKFVGRDDALNTLHEQLQQTDRVAISAVSGMGGIGKTELALQYGRLHWGQEDYPGGVCWLQVRDEDVGIQILNFARAYLKLNPPEEFDLELQLRFCWQNWPIPPNPPYEKSDVLLIFDDVKDYGTIEEFLPSDSRFKILVTTRKQWLGESFQRLELKVLSASAA